MSPSESVAISIDLGGTRYRVAAVSTDGRVLARLTGRSAAEYEPSAVIDDLVAAVKRIQAELSASHFVGLGVAAPGPIDEEARIVLVAPNFPRWKDVPLAAELERQLELPAYLGNDANLAALGEFRHGAGRGVHHMVYLTVSTGIGGGVIVDGRLLLGSRGAAGEAGHMQIAADGPRCNCGNHGCLEAFAAGSGLARRALAAIEEGAETTLRAIGNTVTAVDIGEAAAKGDALALDLVESAGRALGVGVRNLIHIFDPSVVVIGGGVSQMGALLWDPMRAIVASDPYVAFRGSARIEPAALHDDSGLVGAAVMVFEPEVAGLQPRVRTA